MPGLTCSCGHRINFGEIPCKDEWLFISDVAFDAIVGDVDAEELYRRMRSFLRCPACGSLWVYWNGYEGEPQKFVPMERPGFCETGPGASAQQREKDKLFDPKGSGGS